MLKCPPCITAQAKRPEDIVSSSFSESLLQVLLHVVVSLLQDVHTKDSRNIFSNFLSRRT